MSMYLCGGTWECGGEHVHTCGRVCVCVRVKSEIVVPIKTREERRGRECFPEVDREVTVGVSELGRPLYSCRPNTLRPPLLSAPVPFPPPFCSVTV